jgi:ribonuclease Z
MVAMPLAKKTRSRTLIPFAFWLTPILLVLALGVIPAVGTARPSAESRARLSFQEPHTSREAPLKVILLGTGSPRPAMSRFGPSILVIAGDKKLLFDCGRGITQRIYQLKIPFNEADALFLTHLHSDHTVAIPDLWLTGWVMGRKVPLRVWGPAGTTDMTAHLQEAYAFDVHVRRDVDEKLSSEGVVIQARDIEPGVAYEENGLKVTAFVVDHGPVKPAFGYRVDFAGHAVVLSGDTRFSENLIRAAQGTDVLIHEVLDLDAYRQADDIFTPEQMQRVIAHHTTPEQAAVIFSRVHPKLAVFSHIVPINAPNVIAQTRKTYSGPLELGEDLMTIDIGDQVQVHHPMH